MIEVIRTLTGYTRPDGRAKVVEGRAFRCDKCELISTSYPEIKQHQCTTPVTRKKQ